jgi:hypothetical protein
MRLGLLRLLDTNIAFGGDDWTTLYFTSRNHLGMTKVKIPGIPVPVGRK